MKTASQFIIFVIISISLASCDKETVLTIEGNGLNYNAVVSLFPSANAVKPISVKSLKNKPQVYSVKFKKSGYGRLELSSGSDISFWIYLDDGAQEIIFDSKNLVKYPVIFRDLPQASAISLTFCWAFGHKSFI
jgi:hypothetical protein